jgi:hypothetical protein
METYNDLLSKLKNLKYYKDEVGKLLLKQNEYDISKDHGRQINNEVMELRFKCLGICLADMEWIDSYIHNAMLYIQKANELDKKIFKIEEEVIPATTPEEVANEIPEPEQQQITGSEDQN